MYTCRICFEESDREDDVISPCKCIGTQKYVHKKCLNMWRYSSIYGLRRWKCSVCNTCYDIPGERRYVLRVSLQRDEIGFLIRYNISLIPLFLLLSWDFTLFQLLLLWICSMISYFYDFYYVRY